MSVKLDSKVLKKGLKQLGPKAVKPAANQAINKALTGARTDATKHLAPKTEVRKQKAIRDRITLIKSNPKKLRGIMVIGERNIPLSDVKNVRVTGRGRKQVVKWKGRTIKGAFKVKGGIGSLNDPIFIRNKKQSKGGYYRGYSFTLLQQYRKHKTAERLRKTVQVRLDKEFNRQLARRFAKLGF